MAYNCAIDALKGILRPYPDAALGKRAIDAERTRHLLERHARNPHLAVADIVAMLGIPERTLYKVMREAGYPPIGAMLRDIRLDRVHKRVCAAEPFDMDEATWAEGFPNTRSLRAAYRARYGCTPAEKRAELFGDNSGNRKPNAKPGPADR